VRPVTSASAEATLSSALHALADQNIYELWSRERLSSRLVETRGRRRPTTVTVLLQKLEKAPSLRQAVAPRQIEQICAALGSTSPEASIGFLDGLSVEEQAEIVWTLVRGRGEPVHQLDIDTCT
jgi:hypothetical protein